MTEKKYEEKLHIDMDLEEALERFVHVDPQELQANLDKNKRKKKPPAAPGKGTADGPPQAVIRLRDARKRQNHG